MAESEYDSENEILDKNRKVKDSSTTTIHMDWIDHDLETLACENYSGELHVLAFLKPASINTLALIQNGDIQENTVVCRY